MNSSLTPTSPDYSGYVVKRHLIILSLRFLMKFGQQESVHFKGTVSRESLQKYKSPKTHLRQWQATGANS